jgi:HAD superfamily hydrolase (TIGR01509 family)
MSRESDAPADPDPAHESSPEGESTSDPTSVPAPDSGSDRAARRDDDGGGDGDAPSDPSPPDADAIAAVLFDMDGVLVDSQRYWEAFEEEYVLEGLLADVPDVDRSAITGRSVWDVHAHLVETYGLDVSEADFLDAYRERAREIYFQHASATPGVGDLIDALRDEGYPVGIVSSSPREWIGWVVDALGVGPLAVTWSAEDVDGPGKPAPRIYEAAAERLGVDPGRCLVVEDSETGIAAAARAGAYVIGYRAAPDVDTEPAIAAGADEVVTDPATLCARVGSVAGLPSAE